MSRSVGRKSIGKMDFQTSSRGKLKSIGNLKSHVSLGVGFLLFDWAFSGVFSFFLLLAPQGIGRNTLDTCNNFLPFIFTGSHRGKRHKKINGVLATRWRVGK